ncbi:MAG: Type I Iterative PKS [Bogoriella megaspora]|nr:MAG: Type I Iterative PKS [Bogoriella megaspora]
MKAKTLPFGDSSDESIAAFDDTPGTTKLGSTPQAMYARDVAVVGMACRVAGGNNSPEELWQYILDQKVGVGDMPSTRWEPYRRRDTRNGSVLDSTTTRGYFLDNVEGFDAAFFGISPREAEQMDPQQRISLEVAYEALEHAGIPPQDLAGSDTAVYWGVNSDDYSKLLLEDLPNVDAWMGIGTAYCGVPNRISYCLNLTGPSAAIDAACGSSLVAIHHGRQAILQGESKVAIVGGVNVMCSPGLSIVLDKAGVVSPDGCCRSFDDAASGYGRGEGVAAIVLKNMQDAIRDHDHIYAVLKGTAVSHNGRTQGIMTPSGKAQELVARKALSDAGIDPSTVQYVEAHATSTSLGDPTEVSALADVYGECDSLERGACWIGSGKPNFGHLEAGAGATGFIKTVLALQKGILPPQANLTKLNTRINWENSSVRVVQEASAWPEGTTRRAAIASYGYGGTVSHAVIEEYVQGDYRIPSPTAKETDHSVLLLSSPQEEGIALQAKSLRSWLSSSGKKHGLHTIATTLALRREHHNFRASVVAESHDNAIETLEALIQGSSHPLVNSSRILPSGANEDGTVWVFSGHGAQWDRMGQDLIHDAIFASAIGPLDYIVQKEMEFSAIEALRTGDFDSSDKVQVLTYIMQIGITAVMKHKAVFPDAVIGHSVGEIAASVVAGALTPEEGTLVVCKRAALYRQFTGSGSMVLVGKPFDEISRDLSHRTDIVAAIDSSPSSCVVSGRCEAVEELRQQWHGNGIKLFTVKSDIPFHSPMLNCLVDPLLCELKDRLSPRPPDIKLYSTSLGDPRGSSLRDAQYWTNNMVNPVMLTTAIEAAADDGFRRFLEVSAHPVVCHSISEIISNRQIEDFVVIPTMIRNMPAQESILHSIAQLHCSGWPVSWQAQLSSQWTSDVPTTTWNHKSFWKKIDTGHGAGEMIHDVKKHVLLGQHISVPESDFSVYTSTLDESVKPFPGSHPLHGTEIVPAAVLINTFLHAAGAPVLYDVMLKVPVAVSAPRDIQVVLNQGNIRISSRLITRGDDYSAEEASWLTHTTAKLRADAFHATVSSRKVDVRAIMARTGIRLQDDFSVQYLAKVGVSAMGFPWVVTEHWGNTEEMIAKVDVAPGVEDGANLAWDELSWAPILDAATSVGSTIFFDEPCLRMPCRIDRVQIHVRSAPPKRGWVHCLAHPKNKLTVDVSILDEEGNIIATLTSMRFSTIDGTPGIGSGTDNLVHQIAWPPAVLAECPLVLDKVVFVSQDTATIHRYGKALPAQTEVLYLSSPGQLTADLDQRSMVVYVPGGASTLDDVSEAAQRYSKELLDIVQYVVSVGKKAKVFVITINVARAETPSALAQSPLYGLARIAAGEQPESFGGLVDAEEDEFPLQAIKYVQNADVVRIDDSVARVARLRLLQRDKLPERASTLLPNPAGSYLITGGLGALGLEVADFLTEKGVRRLILTSRRAIPPRKRWSTLEGSLFDVVSKIQALERRGASVHVLCADVTDVIGLGKAIEELNIPAVVGVIHAAGVLENQLIVDMTDESFAHVLKPKVAGALALHNLFPPKTIDFFVLFSSCGQLFGFPGQGSYASGNAFLDALARHRRHLGDNSIAIQWTAWRDLGMGASSDYINAELNAKGITDITREDAFHAWDLLSRYDTQHGVVLRCLALNEGEPLPHPILNDVSIRRPVSPRTSDDSSASSNSIPKSGPELKRHLADKIRHCVAEVLHTDPGTIDSRAALSDMGIDSVMTARLRQQLQRYLKVNVPPTLIWNHPTIGHLATWFEEKLLER